jgi:hypothetical protein
MKIECFLSEGCGSYHQLRENVDRALAELDVSADVTFPIVYSYDEGLGLGLRGSPHIRINGRDFDESGAPGIS